MDFGNLLGVDFLSNCLFFLGLRLSILSVSSEVCFLVGLGQKMMPGSVVGCVENIQKYTVFFVGLGEKMMPGSMVGCVENMLNTMVFVRFHFFTYLVNWMISKLTFG